MSRISTCMQIDTDCNVKCSLCHVFQHRQIDTGSNVKCSLCDAFQHMQTDTDSNVKCSLCHVFHIDKLILAATSSARYVTHFNLSRLILTATSEQRRAEDGTCSLITTMTKITTKKKHLRLLLISPEQRPPAQLPRKTEFALRF